jgi:hypothetical protein
LRLFYASRKNSLISSTETSVATAFDFTPSGMTVKEAAQLVRKSTRTIRSWKADGCNVHDEAELRERSDNMDARSRGKSRTRVIMRDERQNRPVTAAAPDLASYFQLGIEPDAFVDLTSPFSPVVADAAFSGICAMQRQLAARVRELKVIGHQYSIALAEAELEALAEALKIVERIIYSYDDKI